MESRRDFLKKAVMLAAGGGMAGALPASIQRAFAIDPTPGSTFLDAEHVVILMQENRSFDHTFGTLRGVRGFNDPRAVTLPNGNPVWLQSNDTGETCAPFRLDIKETKATWMGSLPHGRGDQLEARNRGRHDRWLDAKKNGQKEFAQVPLTMGYYTRTDIPFYYALADAFTVCDQNFCSSLTPTTPNRLYLWTGTVRADAAAKAHVNNEDADYNAEVHWKTFPERLEENGVSWKVYQNEIGISWSKHDEEAGGWLANFGDNPLEYFSQYQVRFAPSYRSFREGDELRTYTEENFAKLSQQERNLHLKAFANNASQPDYRGLSSVSYHDGASEKQMLAPKGDIFHQFREDVRTGQLPAVSWLVAPEKFSDHPTSPWYGAWYVSETLDILTQNPEVWRKTIFILCYDENDGYFDHVPPFVPPHPTMPNTGKVSAGIDTAPEHVTAEQEAEIRKTQPDWKGNVGPIGLGFRVPLVIASPWSRGGYVCSEVFDHTSILKFLEVFLSHKTGRTVRESNISAWRRTVCGDLTSSFRAYNGEKIAAPTPLERDAVLGSIQRAEEKPVPNDYRNSPLARQETGTRPSCPLPYELAVDGASSEDRQSFVVNFAACNTLFGSRAVGAPFHAYAAAKSGWSRVYAVAAGDKISDRWLLSDFENAAYHIRVHGPNGFFREFRGSANDPKLEITLNGAEMRFVNHNTQQPYVIQFAGEMGALSVEKTSTITLPLDVTKNFGWYDVRIRVEGAADFEQRFAGRVETGRESISDPKMA